MPITVNTRPKEKKNKVVLQNYFITKFVHNSTTKPAHMDSVFECDCDTISFV